MRPGRLTSNLRPRHKRGNQGLGDFGKSKAVVAPSPGPGSWTGANWQCPGEKPAPTDKGYYVCCPNGWRLRSNDAVGDPCGSGEDKSLFECGPLPTELAVQQVADNPVTFKCVGGQWMPRQQPLPVTGPSMATSFGPSSASGFAPEMPDTTSTIPQPNARVIAVGGIAVLIGAVVLYKIIF